MAFEDALRAFRSFAPLGSPWSRWSKPTGFDCPMVPAPMPIEPGAWRIDAVPPADGKTALVVDMDGGEVFSLALALAGKGYQPIPLHNATSGSGVNLFTAQLVTAMLYTAAPVLESLRVPESAPPVFLIDANRCRGTPLPLNYDNRWLVFPQDVPSARFLRAADVTNVVVIRRQETLLHDLRAILRGWRRGGLAISFHDPLSATVSPATFSLSWPAMLVDHFRLVFSGLSENSAGGFGSTVPDLSGG